MRFVSRPAMMVKMDMICFQTSQIWQEIGKSSISSRLELHISYITVHCLTIIFSSCCSRSNYIRKDVYDKGLSCLITCYATISPDLGKSSWLKIYLM